MKHFSLFLLLLLAASAGTAQVVNIEEQRITGTNDSVRWYGYLRGSAALIQIKQQSLQLNGQARVQYKKDPHMVLLLLNVSLLRAGQQDFVRQSFAHLRYNYKITEKLVWEAYGQIQASPIQLLQQRTLAGTGLRMRLLKSANGRQRLYAGTAWLWERNAFSENLGVQHWNRSSNYLSLTLRAGKQAVLIGTTYWQPVWGLAGNYRVSTDWLLKVDITKKLALTVEFDYAVDKNLPPGASATTYALRNGITLSL